MEKERDESARAYTTRLLDDYLIETDDGSPTLKSGLRYGVDEKMHTQKGAQEEAFQKFIYPAQLEDKKKIKVLDLCTGLGYNAAALLEYSPSKIVDLDMVEISPEILLASLLVTNPIPSHRLIKKVVEDKLIADGYLYYQHHNMTLPPNYHLNLFLEDARRLLIDKMLKGPYDAIFLDGYSPLLTPELYTVDFFIEIRKIIGKEGLLLTYTSAAPVRSALIKAGFHLGETPAYGRRKGGTVASLSSKKIMEGLPEADERMIALSDAGIPFRDPDLQANCENIVRRRSDERRRARGKSKIASTVKTPLYLCKDVEDPRLKRRVNKHLRAIGLNSHQTLESCFLVCPQYEKCICNCDEGREACSRDRILIMANRLKKIVKNKQIM